MRRARVLTEPWPWFALAGALVAAGFYPTFFAVLPALDAPHLLHGSSATLWMLLPLVQYRLVRSGRRHLHRVVGYVSLLLAGTVVITGLRVVQLMASNKSLTDMNFVRGKFVLLDLTGLALFCVFLGLAIQAARRRDIGLHVRLLACTALIPLEAALERLLMNGFPTLVPDFGAGLTAALFSMEAICVLIIAAEWRSGRVRWPLPTLLAYYVLTHILATPIASQPAFQQFCRWYSQLGA
ncbi:MAG TPA: hypothetical protein VJS12_18105 [Steroidobacteraceae bacterium]|nr:hypothetical protein [Steroidobacteraceae bacterium]